MPGVKGRSGRKPEPEMKSFRAVLDEHISPEQWDKILDALARAAADGNIPALRLLVAYRYGSPRPEAPPPPAGASVGEIAFLLPVRDGEVLPPDAIMVKKDEKLLGSTPGSAD